MFTKLFLSKYIDIPRQFATNLVPDQVAAQRAPLAPGEAVSLK